MLLQCHHRDKREREKDNCSYFAYTSIRLLFVMRYEMVFNTRIALILVTMWKSINDSTLNRRAFLENQCNDLRKSMTIFNSWNDYERTLIDEHMHVSRSISRTCSNVDLKEFVEKSDCGWNYRQKFIIAEDISGKIANGTIIILQWVLWSNNRRKKKRVESVKCLYEWGEEYRRLQR